MSQQSPAASKQGLVLDEVVLVGRHLDEYRRFFELDLDALRNSGNRVLDVASGVSSFCAEANAMGIETKACDLIYALDEKVIRQRCSTDLEKVAKAMAGLPTYRWETIGSVERMRELREQAYLRFLEDYPHHRGARYVTGRLPELPFADHRFDLTLLSYLLFVYEEHFDYAFHKAALLEVMRITSLRGEARFYPIVNYECQPSAHLAEMLRDPDLEHLDFEIVPTDFEFLRNSNQYLRVRHRSAT